MDFVYFLIADTLVDLSMMPAEVNLMTVDPLPRIHKWPLRDLNELLTLIDTA